MVFYCDMQRSNSDRHMLVRFLGEFYQLIFAANKHPFMTGQTRSGFEVSGMPLNMPGASRKHDRCYSSHGLWIGIS